MCLGRVYCSIQLARCAERIPSHEHVIVQEYVERPLIVDGFKCDLRIYVLVTSCSPLRVFLFNDGLLRMSTERYVAPTENNMVRFFCCCGSLSIPPTRAVKSGCVARWPSG